MDHRSPKLVWKMPTPGHVDSGSSRRSTNRLPASCITRLQISPSLFFLFLVRNGLFVGCCFQICLCKCCIRVSRGITCALSITLTLFLFGLNHVPGCSFFSVMASAHPCSTGPGYCFQPPAFTQSTAVAITYPFTPGCGKVNLS